LFIAQGGLNLASAEQVTRDAIEQSGCLGRNRVEGGIAASRG
jgi:hypothetical protein